MTSYNFTTVPEDANGPLLDATKSIPSGNAGRLFKSDNLLLRFDEVEAISNGSAPLSVVRLALNEKR